MAGLKELQTYHERTGYNTIKPVEAYTPRLEDAAEAIGELLVYLRTHGTMSHEQAVRDTVLRGYKKCGDKMLLLIVNSKAPMKMMQLILEDIA